ncbi:hypothetical protein POM88_012931 [Heracleum sosnowskyi]|uniref:RRM domain-containing protein n=1 Tax=Heracleum sosnowskyi TaxID=360622 RepID=A0AAD8IXM5_9APIA|nr:hypothetical protein POM88_012931 [Heracleum sosnowskyi]
MNRGKEFQTSNENNADEADRNNKENRGEEILKEFVKNSHQFVDKEVYRSFLQGDSVAFSNALKQIHWRSLKIRPAGRDKLENGLPARVISKKSIDGENSEKRLYSQVVIEGARTEERDGWKTVTHKKKNFKTSSNVKVQGSTIFVSKIPNETTAKEIWDLFQNGGDIWDIILPRKRDRKGNRIGFVKTSSELESGRIISNLKQFKGLGRVLKMSINRPQEESVVKKITRGDIGSKKVERSLKDPVTHGEDKNKDAEDDIATKMFSYIESEVDEDIERSMLESLMLVDTKFSEAKEVLKYVEGVGITNVKVVQVSDSIFFLRREGSDDWLNEEKELLGKGCQVVRKVTEKDLVLPRIAHVKCVGLPINAWLETNLKAFTKSFGEWVSCCFQDETLLKLHNPVITLVTSQVDRIEEYLTILVKGKQYKVLFHEIKEHAITEQDGALYKNASTDKHGINMEDFQVTRDEQKANEKVIDKNLKKSENFPEKIDLYDRNLVGDNMRSIGGVDSSGVRLGNKETDGPTNENDLSLVLMEESLQRYEASDDIGTVVLESLSATNEFQVGEGRKLDILKTHCKVKRNTGVCNSLSSSEVSLADEEINSVAKDGEESDDGKSNDHFDQISIGSQGTLCKNLRTMSMGVGRGRPRKRPKRKINPFDFKFSKKNMFKSNKGDGFIKRTGGNLLKIVEDGAQDSNIGKRKNFTKEATDILDTAIHMGLEIPGGREQGIETLARNLEKND